MTDKKRLATIWLDGCSGCHMSLLDMDARLLELADQVDVVYSPLVDAKEFPPDVDLTLVEGAIATDEDEERIRRVRSRTRTLVSLGDCAVMGNVPAMRNPFGVQAVLDRAYLENADSENLPTDRLPRLRATVVPVHELVRVDVTLPGCPPAADVIYWAITELLAGRIPDVGTRTRFGA